MKKSLGKILLYNSINRSFFSSDVDPINLGLLALSSVLKQSGYETVLIPNVDSPRTLSLLKKELKTAIMVGVSCKTGDPILNGIKFAKLVKKLKPKIPICWGGYHVTMDYRNSIAEDFVDYVIRGQGEKAIIELLTAVKKKSGFNKILGLVYQKNNQTIVNPIRPIEPIDQFPPFDYQLYFDCYPNSPVDMIYCSSRGCPFECTFCSVSNFYGKRYLTYSTDRFLSDLDSLVKTYRPKSLTFWDDNFFVDKNRVMAFLKFYLQQKYTFTWLAFARCSSFTTEDKEYMRLLKKCNCICLLFGAESGSPRIIKLIKKHLTNREIIKSCRVVSKYGIMPDYTFISGFPSETVKDLKMTMEVIRRLNKINPRCGVRLFSFNLFPGTPILQDCIKYGFIPPTKMSDWAKYEFHSFIPPWITQEHQSLIKSLVWITTFVSPDCVPRTGRWFIDLPLKLLHYDALWRLRHNFF